jgi:hypothetical protein
MSPLKRKAEKPVSPPKTKKPKIVVPEYHLTPLRQDDAGEDVWPARAEQIDRARKIIKEWFVQNDWTHRILAYVVQCSSRQICLDTT